jgi:hypothetical protein
MGRDKNSDDGERREREGRIHQIKQCQRCTRRERMCCTVGTCAAPIEALNEGVSTSLGTGMMISTLLAIDLDLYCDLVLIMYSILLLLCGSTTASTQMRGFTACTRVCA